MADKVITDDAKYKELRDEWSGGGKKAAEKALGNICYNCGSDESIELHHIVPLKVGGTNSLTNIAVLCHKCHMAAHYGRHIRDYQNKDVSGRPHKADADATNSALRDYVWGVIGAKECKVRMNLSEKSKVTDSSAYKEFLKANGIKTFRNNIDIIVHHKGKVSNGDKVGYIEFINGKYQYLEYRGDDNE